MPVLILKNVESEGPGTLEDFFVQADIPYTISDLSKEDAPPAAGFDTLIMLGGPMSVNDEKEYPYLTNEMKMAEQFMKSGKKVFGVCLGAQLMAKALGARVYPGPEKEIGWYDIELTDGGIRDRMMGKLAVHPRGGDFWRRFKVFHWHGETFDIPEGAERLAGSELYPNQAFRYGGNAYAFQFHIEVSKQMIFEWLKNEALDKEQLRTDTERCYADYAARAVNFYEAFFRKGIGD
jgi:GMP synthase-like glutamine amidotransferase